MPVCEDETDQGLRKVSALSTLSPSPLSFHFVLKKYKIVIKMQWEIEKNANEVALRFERIWTTLQYDADKTIMPA